MDSGTYRYSFDPAVSLQDVEESLLLAVVTAECIYGRARVQLDGTFCLDKAARTCVVDAGTDVGRDIARIFTGYLSREFGEWAFRVERDGECVPRPRTRSAEAVPR